MMPTSHRTARLGRARVNSRRGVNLDRMRAAVEPALAENERAARQSWLDGLTPEHRRIHEGRPGVCGICLREASRRASVGMAQAIETMAARVNSRRGVTA